MRYNEYEYDYHHLAEEADYIEEESTNSIDDLFTSDSEIADSYHDSGTDEPWMDEDDDIDWENYYHNLTDEITDN